MERNARVSATEIGSTSSSGGGMLIQRATAGAAIHIAANGIAAHNACGRATATVKSTAKATRTLATMRPYVAKSFRSTAYLACAAVTHCSRFLRVKSKRTSVRTIASVISHAWYAIKVTVKPICDAPSDRSERTSRKWLRLEVPLSRAFKPTRKGIGDDGQNEASPHPGRYLRCQPARQHQQERARRRNRAAQIVNHLPTADRGNRDFAALLFREAAAPENPRQELPVSASPAMLPRRRHFVMRWKFIEELDIASQRGAGEDAFEQVVTQQRVFPGFAGHRLLERVEVVNSLPGVRALVKQILINIGDRRRVRVNSTGAGENSLEQRAFAIRGKRRRNARLHYSVTVHHAS